MGRPINRAARCDAVVPSTKLTHRRVRSPLPKPRVTAGSRAGETDDRRVRATDAGDDRATGDRVGRTTAGRGDPATADLAEAEMAAASSPEVQLPIRR